LEKVANLLIGLSFFFWAIMGLAFVDDAGSIVRLAIVALHICAGWLVIFRSPAVDHGNIRAIIGCLPSFVAAGLLFRLAHSTDHWPLWNSLLFLAATALAMFSLISLGNSFAVFPSVRETKIAGAYSVVRHPAYLGESLMMLCCAIATPTYWSGVIFPIAIATIIWRILIEEKLLTQSPSYQEYRQRVRFRLLPGVW
jgi:protein-S-isoprenylcysteine O-methyltransferase Ste14